MLASRAAMLAARRRGLEAGSGEPRRAAVVISRISLVKILARAASWRPLRCMMFLNCEWPAMAAHNQIQLEVGAAIPRLVGIWASRGAGDKKRRGPKPPLKNVGT